MKKLIILCIGVMQVMHCMDISNENPYKWDYPCNLKVHMESHEKLGRYICDELGCNREFATTLGLRAHKLTHSDEKNYICDIEGCNKAFGSASELTVHKHNHRVNRRFKCTYEGCNKEFHFKKDFNRHMRVHTKEKPFVCSLCGRVFAHKSSLQVHERNIQLHQKINNKKRGRDEIFEIPSTPAAIDALVALQVKRKQAEELEPD